MTFKKKIAQNIINIPGWRTNRKFVVIESDDWGSTRMPSKETYESLLHQGIRVDLCPYNKFDNLASSEDLEALFNLLSQFKDKNDNHPVITANTNVANPDFNQIAQHDFKKYSCEPFTVTLENKFGSNKVFSKWKEGISGKLFYPQLHGREHVNPISWMRLLRSGHQEIKKAFDLGAFGLSRITSTNIKTLYLASLIFENAHEQSVIEDAIAEGAEIFENIFGYKSRSFIAPLYIWDSKLETTMKNVGIKYIQGANSHNNFDASTNKVYRVKRHFCGERNIYGQFYLVRNCSFEPALESNFNYEVTLDQIRTAFKWKKPAIITSHRVNYIGALDRKNRDNNLELLGILLNEILKKWPDVEFINSVQLGEIMENSKNK